MHSTEPELERLAMLISNFQAAIHYRSYSLDDISPPDNIELLLRSSAPRIAQRILACIQCTENFDASDPMSLLSLLRLISLPLNALKLDQ